MAPPAWRTSATAAQSVTKATTERPGNRQAIRRAMEAGPYRTIGFALGDGAGLTMGCSFTHMDAERGGLRRGTARTRCRTGKFRANAQEHPRPIEETEPPTPREESASRERVRAEAPSPGRPIQAASRLLSALSSCPPCLRGKHLPPSASLFLCGVSTGGHARTRNNPYGLGTNAIRRPG